MDFTHQELVKKAAEWARSRCDVVFTERSNGFGELPDVMAWSYRWSMLIECKVSRTDFLRDKRKPGRALDWGKTWGHEDAVGNFRAYCCPRGLIKDTEIPDRWMLLEVYPSGFVRLNVNPWKYDIKKTIWWNELTAKALDSERFMLFRALQDIKQGRESKKIL